MLSCISHYFTLDVIVEYISCEDIFYEQKIKQTAA